METRDLDLHTLRTYVLHVPTNAQRAAHMHALLGGLGMNYALFPALHGEGYIQSAAKSLMALFESILAEGENAPFEPFLLLEDDVMITPWTEPVVDLQGQERLVVCAPADADAVYVGLSTCSADPERETHRIGVVFEETKVPGILRLGNMLSQHAVVICSRRWLWLLLRTLSVSAALGLNWDIPTARVMDRYNVYACARPIFYQDARVGGQQDPTLVTADQLRRLDPASAVSAPGTVMRFEPPAALRAWKP